VVIRVHADAEAVVVVLDAKVARESALAHAELAEELVPYLAVGWRDAGTDTSSLQRRQSRANAQTCTTPQSQRLVGSSESSAACRQGRGAGGEPQAPSVTARSPQCYIRSSDRVRATFSGGRDTPRASPRTSHRKLCLNSTRNVTVTVGGADARAVIGLETRTSETETPRPPVRALPDCRCMCRTVRVPPLPLPSPRSLPRC
jgi:hypothetical protein